MASHIFAAAEAGKTTLYDVYVSLSGQFFSTSAYENYNGSNVANYKRAVSEFGGKVYGSTVPSLPANAAVLVVTYDQAGGSPNLATDDIVNQELMYWDGSQLSVYISSLQVAAAAGTALDANVAELVGVPAANAGVRAMLKLLYMRLRNACTQTTTARTIKDDAGNTIGSSTITDDGTTTNQGKLA